MRAKNGNKLFRAPCAYPRGKTAVVAPNNLLITHAHPRPANSTGRFGYAAFRGGQQAVVEHVAADGDALVLMPTGDGKSLCYQIPALLRDTEPAKRKVKRAERGGKASWCATEAHF